MCGKRVLFIINALRKITRLSRESSSCQFRLSQPNHFLKLRISES